MKLKYQAELTGCENVIFQNYSGKELDLYRWAHNPIEGKDFEVQAQNPLNVPAIEISSASDEDKLARVGKYALSCFLTEADASKVYLDQREKRSSRRSNAGSKFDEQKGGHIQKIHITPQDGLCSEPNEVSHVNFLEYESTDVSLLSIGEPIKIF